MIKGIIDILITFLLVVALILALPIAFVLLVWEVAQDMVVQFSKYLDEDIKEDAQNEQSY